MASSLSDQIVLVGLGRLDFRTYRLLGNLGEAVVVIERNAENQFLQEVRGDATPLFIADARREAVLEDAHIGMSQSAIAAPAFAAAAAEPSLVTTLMVDDQLVVMQRWFVRDEGPLCGKTVGDVMVEYGFGVAERRPKVGAARLFPPPATRLESGDELLVQGRFEDLAALKKKAASLT